MAATDGIVRETVKKDEKEILEYQPDAVEIEEKPVPGKVRWVLYLILLSILVTIVGAIVFKVDRIVVTEGELITSVPPLIVQPINVAMVRKIYVHVGDTVEKGQILATLDPTFTDADLTQLNKEKTNLEVQERRIQAELTRGEFTITPEEGEDGILQAQLLKQHLEIFEKNRKMSEDRIASLQAKLELNRVQREGLAKQTKLLRDVEGVTSRLPQSKVENRLRLLDAQKIRISTENDLNNRIAEEEVTLREIEEAKSEWKRFVEQKSGELIEQQVEIRTELAKLYEAIRKADRLHDLITLRAPEKGIVLEIAKRPEGAVLQAAEPFVTLVPMNCDIEVNSKVLSKDIGRIRTGDKARIKLDAFPFQRHGTLTGEVRVISEDAWNNQSPIPVTDKEQQELSGYYMARIRLLDTMLRDVPEGFRIMPGMKVRAEIKIGKRQVISYFLYPIIRALDESLREP